MTSAAATSSKKVIAQKDYIIMIDKSASMGYADVPNFKDRWHSAQESTSGLARKVHEYDPDGITVYLFGNSFKCYDNVTPSKVDEVFAENEPGGATNLHLPLADAFQKWKKRKETSQSTQGTHIVVVTDGEPTDKRAVVNELIKVSKHIESSEQLAVTFLQAGKDQGARNYLKRLDDDLVSEGAKVDFINTHTFEEMGDMLVIDVLSSSLDD